jgi:hypothetical protein
MTALANEVRELSNTTSTKSIDVMTTDINDANIEVAEQTDLIAQLEEVVSNLPDFKGLQDITITQNGEYLPDENYSGFEKVTVDVDPSTCVYSETDSATAYRKIVPSNSIKFSYLNKLGGMTYKTKNLINPALSIENKRTATSTGGYYTQEGWNVSAKTPITPSANYAHNLSVNSYCAWFDKDGNYIEGFTIEPNKVKWAPSNAYYIRMDYPQGVDVILAKSSTIPVYEPYYDGLRDTKTTEIVSEGANLFSEGTVEVNETSYHTFSLEAGKTYYFSAYVTSTDTDIDTCTINLQYEDNTQFYTNVPRNQRFKKAVTPPKNVSVMRFFSGHNFPSSSGDTSTWTDIMITTADTDVYKPYVGTIGATVIPEAIQALDGYGKGTSTTYYNYIDFERKVFVQNTRRKVFDGTETWNFADATTANNPYGIATTSVALGERVREGSAGILCSHYDFYSVATQAAATKEGCMTLGSGAFVVRLLPYQTVADWKAHLAELYASGNPLTIEYALATPIETPIDIPDALIEVEGDGDLMFENEHKYSLPSTVTYQIVYR